MEEVLRKYEFSAPDDGGPLKFLGDPDDIHVPEIEDGENAAADEKEIETEEDEAEDEAEESDEEDEEAVQRREDLAARMDGLNIEEADFEEIWERLNGREREEFVKLAQELDSTTSLEE
jgi:hypothetical protein